MTPPPTFARRDPLAKAWGDMLKAKRLSGKFIPDAPKLPDGGNRQVDFADYLGVTQGQLSAWELGKSVPSAHWQQRMIQRLGIDPVELHGLFTKAAA